MTVVALTGVPGTGKSTIASHLEDVTIVEANELAHRVDAIEDRDEGRQADLVDEARLADQAPEALPEGDVLIEGHLAHHCPADFVVLLRCHPDELRERLQAKDWPEAKVDENVMAEILDALVPEIEQRPAGELDTTGTEPAELAERVGLLFEKGAQAADALDPLGTVDWTDTLGEGPA